MELDSAIQLIIKGVASNNGSQVWADLGAGSGLFSQALSALLPDKSIIHAIDKNYKAGQKIESRNTSVQIRLSKKDFTTPLNDMPLCDGLIMANSLHYVKDKLTFFQQIKSILQPGGRIIVVEYDTDIANQWVPYPISCKNLQQFLINAGIGDLQKLAAQESVYQTGGMYSALIT